MPDITAGLQTTGAILVNSARDSHELKTNTDHAVVALPATALAQQILGRPLPNTALLSAFLELTGLLPQSALLQTLGERFQGKVLEHNRQLVEQAAARVPSGAWQEGTHATRA